MKLIVGLGNPGKKYEHSRHNIGFMFTKKYASLHNVTSFNAKFLGEVGSFIENGEQILIFRPLTYMNLSGTAIKEVMDFYKLDLSDLVVVYDDKDIPFAKLRLREKGNPGAHNGMKNITECLGNQTNFARIRVGIGHPEHNSDMINFVLSDFSKDELATLDKSFDDVAASCDLFIKGKFNDAMNKYNFKKNDETNN